MPNYSNFTKKEKKQYKLSEGNAFELFLVKSS